MTRVSDRRGLGGSRADDGGGWGSGSFAGSGGEATIDQSLFTLNLALGGPGDGGGADVDGIGGGLYDDTGASVGL
jgi:hypothetical protein